MERHMDTWIIEGARVLLPDGSLEEKTIVCKKGVITAVRDDAGPWAGSVVRAVGKTVVPGYIDVHIHGGGNADWMDTTRDQYRRILAAHARHGTTSLLATTMTAPIDVVHDRVEAIAEAATHLNREGGAQLLGIHLEGPFLNAAHKGAHREDWLKSPRLSDVERVVERAHGWLKWLTMAPEMTPDAEQILNYLVAHDVVCAIGHSDATVSQTKRCIRHGISHVTHLYNAMRPFHHREPGIVGTALTSEDLTVELIADGIHVAPEALRLAVQSKRTDQVLLITDAIRATGMPDGLYELSGSMVRVQNGVARQEGTDTLAGSTLTMDQAVRNMVRLAGVSLSQAVMMASLAPAVKLGLGKQKGAIREGYDGDLVLLDDNLQVHMTMVGGQIAYRQQS